MIWAAVLLAAACLLSGDRASIRARIAVARMDARTPDRADDPLAAASSLDVLAACLSSGMSVAGAARATASSAPRPLARVLSNASDVLALGADSATAWSTVGRSMDPHVEALCRLARRSAASGAALAQGVAELADQSRKDVGDAAAAAADRASVLIAGPLGLCYLPAFVCLGIVPVVMGLAGDVLQSGVW